MYCRCLRTLFLLVMVAGCGDGPVELPDPATIEVSPTSVTLRLEEVRELTARVSGGSPVARPTWVSSDSTVARIGARRPRRGTLFSQNVVATGYGSAVVTASYYGADATVAITVQQKPWHIRVLPDTVFLRVGDGRQLTAQAFDRGGDPIPVGIAWRSTDEAIARVDGGGVVTGIGPGSAAITASAEEVSGTAVVEVAHQMAQLRLSRDTVFFTALADTVRLSAEALDANGNSVFTDPLEWASADESVALVDATGVVAAVGNGVTTVSVQSGAIRASVPVLVAQRTAEVRITPSADTLRASAETVQLRAEALDATGHPVAGGNFTFTWSSSDEGIALVDRDGLVTAVTEGVVEVTAREVGTGLSGTADVLVWFPSDREILAALYGSTAGPQWKKASNWLTDAPLDSWHGVETDEGGRVVGLRLGGNGVRGLLPAELGYLLQLRHLDLGFNELQGAIPTGISRLANLEELHLTLNFLEGAIPAEFGELASLRVLRLDYNRLTGTIPPELGGLSALEELVVSHNESLGTIPLELGQLASLEVLEATRAGLRGPVPPELGSLTNLTHLSLSENYLWGEIPREFGQLVHLQTLNLAANNWAGSIPGELARLSNLRTLDLRTLGLMGSIPRELGQLANLRDLRLSGRLRGMIPPELGRLANLRYLHLGGGQLTGTIPPELGNLENLEVLIVSGPDLTGSIPVELATLRNLRSLVLWHMDLTGPIPPELGDLTRLWNLQLPGNALTGPIPATFGKLRNLRSLEVEGNRLEGPIPREMTALALDDFWWHDTALCAPTDGAFRRWMASIGDHRPGADCPPDAQRILGALYESAGGAGWTNATNWLSEEPVASWYGVEADAEGRVTALDLRDNGLSGTIPDEIVDLLDLRRLDLRENRLTGEILPRLVGLPTIASLYLSGNRFTGTVPSGLAQLTSLRNLYLSDNRFEGALPGFMTELANLTRLHWNGSGLCASDAPWFRAWLASLADHVGGESCSSPLLLSVVAAHVNQAAQDVEGGAPLIAGRPGLLRAYAQADRANSYRPGAQATFFVDGREVFRSEMELASARGIPERAASSPPDQAFLATIPAEVIVPGVEMVVEMELDSVVARSAASELRLPFEGRLALDVVEMPPMELTVVPVLVSEDADSSTLEWAKALGGDHPEISFLSNVLPVGDLNLTVRAEPYVVSAAPRDQRDWHDLLLEIQLLRALDQAPGYYYGVTPTERGALDPSGISYQSNAFYFLPVSLGTTYPRVMTHELGHGMSLGHAPCGLSFNAGLDQGYPYSDGTIGAWGYDARGDSLVPPSTYDVMSYCDPAWISAYSFAKALNFRLEVEGAATAGAAVADIVGQAKRLLLWGSVSPDGDLRTNPVFALDMPELLPARAGPYRLEGLGGDGAVEFSLDFDMDKVSHGGGNFLFAIPFEEDWTHSLERIVLTGPEGRVELTGASGQAMALVLDRETGRLISVLRGEDAASAVKATVAADVTGTGGASSEVEVLVSFALPGRIPD